MRRKSLSLAVLCILAIVASACGTQAGPTATAQATAAVPVTGGTATAGTPTGPAHIGISKSARFGSYLVDGRGMTLYVFTKDKSNTSICIAKCASLWPPLLSSGTPVGAAGLNAGKFGTIKRSDGRMQVTYFGMPLYYYSRDTKPGDANGEKILNSWFVVSPAGAPIR